MVFRKEFAILGAVFGCFIFMSLAFPGGAVQSSVDGTANIPRVATFGDLYTTVIFFLLVALIMLGTVLMVGIAMTLIRLKNLEEVANAYGVDVADLKGMTPMQAAQRLNSQNKLYHLISGDTGSGAIKRMGEQRRLRSRLKSRFILR